VIMVNRDTPSREEKRSRPTLVDQLDQLSETEILTGTNETLTSASRLTTWAGSQRRASDGESRLGAFPPDSTPELAT
jgi:hypothetical protein